MCLLGSILGKAQPGTLDYSFGDSGKVVSKNFGNCYGMVVQSDNKIVCTGNNGQQAFQTVRYLSDGMLDASFGNEGIVNPVIQETGALTTSITIQTDQKLLVAGSGYKQGIPTCVILRFLPDGTLDNSFGINGISDSTFGQGESFPSIVVQPDGKIVETAWFAPGFITIRFMPDGTLDQDFGDKGKVISTFGANAVPDAIAMDAEGRIIVGGNYSGNASEFIIVRYTNNGVLDESFGNNGVIITDFGKHGDQLFAIATQTDGKIIGAGVTGTDFTGVNENMAIVRYNLKGTLDSSFGTDGKVTIVFNATNSQANSLILEPDGKILIGGGTGGEAEGTSVDFALVRLLSDGSLDSAFAEDGKGVTDFGLNETSTHIALQSGKIILAGTSYTTQPENQINYALARYYNDSLSKKQILITKIKKWIQHHNGIEWDNTPGTQSYAVQRSIDGQHWTTVCRSQVIAYSAHYSDPTPSSTGTTYYRLQTTSTSNAVANSNIIAISNDELNVSLSPNPAKNTLSIAGLPTNKKVKITVVDFSGNTAISQQLSPVPPNAGANSQLYNLDVSSLHAGNYVLKVETGTNSVAKQFVKE